MLFRALILLLILSITISLQHRLFSMSYGRVLRDLYARSVFSTKIGLQNSARLYELCGRPMEGIPAVHVAGTNGKGSVCFKSSEALRESGLKTALFVSPHISSYRERLSINGELLSEQDVVSLIEELTTICKADELNATIFELTTMMSFLKIRRSECDIAVIEVGLGGRLDSTNVITPSLCVITSIQLDHMRVLGNTIEEIAVEKAGIMKPGIPVLVGPDCPEELMRSLALEKGAPFYTMKDILPASMVVGAGNSNTDGTNTALSRAVLELLINDYTSSSSSPSHLVLPPFTRRKDIPEVTNKVSKLLENQPTLATTALSRRSKCRFEVIRTHGAAGVGENEVSVDVVLDIAHNVAAIQALSEHVRMTYGEDCTIHVVVGMSLDKNTDDSLEILLELAQGVQNVYCVAAKHPRAAPVDVLRSQLDMRYISVPSDEDDVKGGLGAALVAARREVAEGGKAMVLVCGSAFIMPDAREHLGIQEPKDNDELNNHLSLGKDGTPYVCTGADSQKATVVA